MALDPVQTNPEHYRVVFENDRVRVLEYTDEPGDISTEHHHPDSVMITAGSFRRRLHAHGRSIDVELPDEAVRWLPAQDHYGENTGTTPSHAFFIELKEADPNPVTGGPHLGPVKL